MNKSQLKALKRRAQQRVHVKLTPAQQRVVDRMGQGFPLSVPWHTNRAFQLGRTISQRTLEKLLDLGLITTDSSLNRVTTYRLTAAGKEAASK